MSNPSLIGLYKLKFGFIFSSDSLTLLSSLFVSISSFFSSLSFLMLLLLLLLLLLRASCATLVSKGVYIRKKSSISWLNNRFKFAIITGIITATTTFCIPGLKNFDKNKLHYML